MWETISRSSRSSRSRSACWARIISSSSSSGVSRSRSGWSKIQLDAARAETFPVQYRAFTAPFLKKCGCQFELFGADSDLQIPMSMICVTNSSFGTNFSVLKILLRGLNLSSGLLALYNGYLISTVLGTGSQLV